MAYVGSRALQGVMAKFKSYGGVLETLRTFGLVAIIDAGLREAWLRLGSFVLRLFPWSPRRDYGLLEALLFPVYDYWLRYRRVISAISGEQGQEPVQILEVGSGRGGIVLFLRPGAAQVCLVDLAADNVIPRHSAAARYVRANACQLPFEDASFRTVISVDTLEHIPRSVRPAFIRELKRVAKETVIVTCPLNAQDGRFQAGKADAQLREELKKRNRRVPNWLEEHLRWGHPTLEEVTEELQGAETEGWQNCESWRRFQRFQLRPFLWPLGGLFYLLVLRKCDNDAPYWRGVISWRKGSGMKAGV
jgi:ubiquinone/menaquinone biosynthesis C-methylase UbiE